MDSQDLTREQSEALLKQIGPMLDYLFGTRGFSIGCGEHIMARVIAIIVSAAIFTVLGMGAAALILLNRPAGFQDHVGFITTMMVLVPTVGGLVAGTALGFFASLGLRTPPGHK